MPSAGRVIDLLRRARSVPEKQLRRNIEISRLEAMPRYVSTETDLLGQPMRLVDAASFLSAYRQIFEEETYRFVSANNEPRILDCGANIGLSVSYWKQLYPSAQIIAFEPDPHVFEVLGWNTKHRNLSGVELVNAAVWKETGNLPFNAEGADAGHLDYGTTADSVRPPVQVPTVRLRDYFDEPIDLLKLDIEGAEVEVLRDCKDKLATVRNLFVEYHSFRGMEQNLDEIFVILKRSGFRIHLKSELVAASPFVDRLDYLGMDNSVNLFAYRD